MIYLHSSAYESHQGQIVFCVVLKIIGMQIGYELNLAKQMRLCLLIKVDCENL